MSISYDGGPWNLGVSILEFRGDKIARDSMYVTGGVGCIKVAGSVEVRAIAAFTPRHA